MILRYFSSFGAFFFGTILLAWIWANFFFVPVLGTLGPENTDGDFIGGMCGGEDKAEQAPPAATASPSNSSCARAPTSTRRARLLSSPPPAPTADAPAAQAAAALLPLGVKGRGASMR